MIDHGFEIWSGHIKELVLAASCTGLRPGQVISKTIEFVFASSSLSAKTGWL